MYDIGYNGVKGDDNVFKRRKTIIRVVSVVLCIMMVLGVFSVLMYKRALLIGLKFLPTPIWAFSIVLSLNPSIAPILCKPKPPIK